MTLLAQLFTTLDLKILLRVFKNMVIQINQILQKQKKKKQEHGVQSGCWWKWSEVRSKNKKRKKERGIWMRIMNKYLHETVTVKGCTYTWCGWCDNGTGCSGGDDCGFTK